MTRSLRAFPLVAGELVANIVTRRMNHAPQVSHRSPTGSTLLVEQEALNIAKSKWRLGSLVEKQLSKRLQASLLPACIEFAIEC